MNSGSGMKASHLCRNDVHETESEQSPEMSMRVELQATSDGGVAVWVKICSCTDMASLEENRLILSLLFLGDNVKEKVEISQTLAISEFLWLGFSQSESSDEKLGRTMGETTVETLITVTGVIMMIEKSGTKQQILRLELSKYGGFSLANYKVTDAIIEPEMQAVFEQLQQRQNSWRDYCCAEYFWQEKKLRIIKFLPLLFLQQHGNLSHYVRKRLLHYLGMMQREALNLLEDPFLVQIFRVGAVERVRFTYEYSVSVLKFCNGDELPSSLEETLLRSGEEIAHARWLSVECMLSKHRWRSKTQPRNLLTQSIKQLSLGEVTELNVVCVCVSLFKYKQSARLIGSIKLLLPYILWRRHIARGLRQLLVDCLDIQEHELWDRARAGTKKHTLMFVLEKYRGLSLVKYIGMDAKTEIQIVFDQPPQGDIIWRMKYSLTCQASTLKIQWVQRENAPLLFQISERLLQIPVSCRSITFQQEAVSIFCNGIQEIVFCKHHFLYGIDGYARSAMWCCSSSRFTA
ncbi:hypothetical protein Bca4012_040603 [Brassica carinata]